MLPFAVIAARIASTDGSSPRRRRVEHAGEARREQPGEQRRRPPSRGSTAQVSRHTSAVGRRAARPRIRAPAALGDEALAEVARALQRDGSAGEGEPEADAQQQRPHVVVREGARVLAPAERREPGRATSSRCAAGRRSACRARCRCRARRNVTEQHPHRERVRAAGGAHELRRRQADAEERRRRPRRPPRPATNEPGGVQPGADQARARRAPPSSDVRDEAVQRASPAAAWCGRRAWPRRARRDPAPRPCGCAERPGTSS